MLWNPSGFKKQPKGTQLKSSLASARQGLTLSERLPACLQLLFASYPYFWISYPSCLVSWHSLSKSKELLSSGPGLPTLGVTLTCTWFRGSEALDTFQDFCLVLHRQSPVCGATDRKFRVLRQHLQLPPLACFGNFRQLQKGGMA